MGPGALAAIATVEAMQDWLVNKLASELQLDPEEVNPRAPFSRYDLDSIAAVSFSAELEDALGCELAPTLLWDYPSIAELAAHLVSLFAAKN